MENEEQKTKSEKPCVFQSFFFEYENEEQKNETLIFNACLKIATGVGGRLATMLLHGLCVFLCIPLFEPK